MAFLDGTGLAELWSLVKAEDAKVLATGLAADSKIVTGSYVGIGTSSTGTPLSVSIGFRPKVVIIYRCTANGSETQSSNVVFEIETDYGSLDFKFSSASTYMPERITIVDDGFTVARTNKYGINYNGDTYAYIVYG